LKAREHHHQHECTDCQMSDFQKQGSAGWQKKASTIYWAVQ
jgi:hypothetical protein